MRIAVLVSGGKDSALALHHVLSDGYEVKCLASMIPLREDSWMFHYPNIHLVDLFARAAGIPIAKAETTGIKESEVEDLKHLIETLDIEGIATGAIASNYQKTRIENICTQLRLKCIAPLWGRDPSDLLQELLNLKFEAIITGIYAYGFDKNWLGRRIDDDTVKALMNLNKQYGVSPVGEGGEYETIVLDAPFFRKRIRIIEFEEIWEKQRGCFLITKAELADK